MIRKHAVIGIMIAAMSVATIGAQVNPLSAIGRAIARVGIEHEQRPALMRAIADELNADAGQPLYGVLVKRSGNNCGGLSCDVICSGQGADQRQWDVLRDERLPAFNEVAQATMRRDVCEIRAGGGPGPVPQPTPPPTPPQLDRVAQLVEQLVERVRALQERLDDLDRHAIADVRQRLEEFREAFGAHVAAPPALPPLRCTGNTKPFGGALVLDCDKR